MSKPPLPLTALSEVQRAQAHIARTHQIPTSTIQLWVKRYRETGLAGLANAARSDKGKSRRLPTDAIGFIEGLALQTPPRSMASIHRQVVEIAEQQGWKPPGYDRVRQIIKSIDPALVTYAHQGAAAYREEFDLLYRREATHANTMWQADHTPLDVWLLDEAGRPAKPYLTVIEDDYSRMIVGYRLSFQPATALTTALTLRQAIWRKEEKRLMRAPQLYSRIGFAYEMEPLSDDEARHFLEKRWSHRVKAYSDDFTDKEAIATILRITRGNIRLIERLLLQVEHVLLANQMQLVTKDVVETAQKNLIIGPG